MTTATPCRTQAAIVAAEGKPWRFDWRLPEGDDAAYFVEHPSARFRARPWRMSDDRRASGAPPLGTHYSDLKDMELITLVFRSGCRIVRCFYPRDHLAWRDAVSDARYILMETPELGVDGDNPLPGLQS